MVIIKNYKVKKIILQISGKIGINFRKFSAGNFWTHNRSSSQAGNEVCTFLCYLIHWAIDKISIEDQDHSVKNLKKNFLKTRDVTIFEFEYDEVQTSNIFIRFEIRRMF